MLAEKKGNAFDLICLFFLTSMWLDLPKNLDTVQLHRVQLQAL